MAPLPAPLPAFAGATKQDGGYALYRISQVIPYSGADNPRERAGFDALLGQLPFQPWRVYNGCLDAAELFAVVRDAAQKAALRLRERGPGHAEASAYELARHSIAVELEPVKQVHIPILTTHRYIY